MAEQLHLWVVFTPRFIAFLFGGRSQSVFFFACARFSQFHNLISFFVSLLKFMCPEMSSFSGATSLFRTAKNWEQLKTLPSWYRIMRRRQRGVQPGLVPYIYISNWVLHLILQQEFPNPRSSIVKSVPQRLQLLFLQQSSGITMRPDCWPFTF